MSLTPEREAEIRGWITGDAAIHDLLAEIDRLRASMDVAREMFPVLKAERAAAEARIKEFGEHYEIIRADREDFGNRLIAAEARAEKSEGERDREADERIQVTRWATQFQAERDAALAQVEALKVAGEGLDETLDWAMASLEAVLARKPHRAIPELKAEALARLAAWQEAQHPFAKSELDAALARLDAKGENDG